MSPALKKREAEMFGRCESEGLTDSQCKAKYDCPSNMSRRHCILKVEHEAEKFTEAMESFTE